MTLAESTYHSLRDDILRGRLAPDQPLRLEFLKSRYGTSFSPLREALNRLAAERLVVNGPGRGFAVSPVSARELWDAMDVRILIEAEALRRAIARGDDAWETEVVASFHALDLLSRRLEGAVAPADADLAELEARHRDFHLALLHACGSPRLLDLFHHLHAETQRYRLLTFQPARGRTRRDLSREHREIMQATLDRREDEAVELLTQHYHRTAEAIHPREG